MVLFFPVLFVGCESVFSTTKITKKKKGYIIPLTRINSVKGDQVLCAAGTLVRKVGVTKLTGKANAMRTDAWMNYDRACPSTTTTKTKKPVEHAGQKTKTVSSLACV